MTNAAVGFSSAPKFILKSLDWFERPVAYRKPFKFGAATITEAPQLFLKAEIETDRGRSIGATAELMVPKWFNKDPALTTDETVEQLRRVLTVARDCYFAHDKADTAFGLHAACHADVLALCVRETIPGLAAAFGPAQFDKAILDALLRAHNLDVFSGLRGNVVGLDARLTPDLTDGAITSYLESRVPPRRVMVRHTFGMADPIESLAETYRKSGCRYFKIKLSGDPMADAARLELIVAELDRHKIDYRATLDANEQYADLDALAKLTSMLMNERQFAQFPQRLLYIEQPLPRDLTFTTPLGVLGESFAFIVDEAESDYDTFPKALALGYRGISSKSCKGIYKSLLNGARAAAWTQSGKARAFLAAEDLTCQAGLSVQQDTALLAFHGIAHAERNGHHYVDGFASASDAEIEAFCTAHPDFYAGRSGLAVRDGGLEIGSLTQPGFASGVDPASIAAPHA
ncbi:hypothetical protein [Pseudorhodoplanes sinuspersici]|uniref:Uncharacterized protein n=1 Tax=Pseudorhodoplanes sinuspersici TaxID=1235591 RepID=A0A1W6ZQE9_9HYPH|nr:hypothetical protein [Pseudorhodoplanes sinuspersici]ARP99340.1 hypothetical protein CAK95_09770 [Pseudorhodoplanes sinuspersici]RKE70269.1 hypothetical protein DFP91_2500 [Pseudorhodoplanes sinuspersici]